MGLRVFAGRLGRPLALLLLSTFAPLAGAEPSAIVFVAPVNESMPLARFENEQLVGGIYRELGDAIAARLGLEARYLPLPGARVSEGLNSGRADVLCYARPEWMQGSFAWSAPLIDDAEMVIARADAPAIHQIADLADQPVGTVIAYHYRELQAALGEHFRRDDAQTMEMNLRRVAAGRLHYAVIEKLLFDYAMRREPNPLLRVDLVYSPIKAMCALSRQSAIAFSDFDRAVNSLIADGTAARIMESYR
jgi:ABC-type amino acid transport substrate-binding protein